MENWRSGWSCQHRWEGYIWCSTHPCWTVSREHVVCGLAMNLRSAPGSQPRMWSTPKDAVADFHRVLPQRPSPEGPFSTTRTASSGLHAPPCASTRLQSTPRADSRFLFTNFGVEGTTCHEFVGLAGARETAKSTAAELLSSSRKVTSNTPSH